MNTFCCAFNFRVLSAQRNIYLQFLKIYQPFTCIASFNIHGLHDIRIKKIKYVVNVSVRVEYAIPNKKVWRRVLVQS